MVRGGWDAVSRNDERMIEYVRDHGEIRDVIVSGGDPLTLPTTKLKFFLDSLSAIPHVDVIRIGTRVPVKQGAPLIRSGFTSTTSLMFISKTSGGILARRVKKAYGFPARHRLDRRRG